MEWHTTRDDRYKRVLRNDVSRIELKKYPSSGTSTVTAIFDFGDGFRNIAFSNDKRDAEAVVGEVQEQIEQLSLKQTCPTCGQELPA